MEDDMKNTNSTTTERASMSSLRKTSLVAGQETGQVLFALPIALWEVSLGIYLVVKGFKPSHITAGM